MSFILHVPFVIIVTIKNDNADCHEIFRPLGELSRCVLLIIRRIVRDLCASAARLLSYLDCSCMRT